MVRRVNVAFKINFIEITPAHVRTWFTEPKSVHSVTATTLVLVDFVEFVGIEREGKLVDISDASLAPSITWIRQVFLDIVATK
jgi:hypothetical protein